MSAGGSPLSPDMLKSCPAVAEQAMYALKAMHQQNMLGTWGHCFTKLCDVRHGTINVAGGRC